MTELQVSWISFPSFKRACHEILHLSGSESNWNIFWILGNKIIPKFPRIFWKGRVLKINKISKTLLLDFDLYHEENNDTSLLKMTNYLIISFILLKKEHFVGKFQAILTHVKKTFRKSKLMKIITFFLMVNIYKKSGNCP